MLIDNVASKRWSDLLPREVSASSPASFSKSGRQSTLGQPLRMGPIKGRRVFPDNLLQRSDERCKRSNNNRHRFSWTRLSLCGQLKSFSTTIECHLNLYVGRLRCHICPDQSVSRHFTFYVLLAHLISNETSWDTVAGCSISHPLSFLCSPPSTEKSEPHRLTSTMVC